MKKVQWSIENQAEAIKELNICKEIIALLGNDTLD
jgi:hypothetical protein